MVCCAGMDTMHVHSESVNCGCCLHSDVGMYLAAAGCTCMQPLPASPAVKPRLNSEPSIEMPAAYQ